MAYSRTSEHFLPSIPLHVHVCSNYLAANKNDEIEKYISIIEKSTDYMAFGLSGSDTSFSMVNADVVVADWVETDPRAVDYFITSRAQVNILLYLALFLANNI